MDVFGISFLSRLSRYGVFLVGIILLTACKAGGGVTARPEASVIVPLVQVPTIANPTSTPFYSRDSSLVINGMCMEGDVVQLAGDSTQQQVCANSTYAFNVSETLDGIYSFVINQIDPSKNVSPSVSMVWVRATSIPVPTITTPVTSPFASAQNSLTLAGTCQSGATLTLSGDASGSQLCANSQYSFSILKSADGVYNITVTQSDPAGNMASAAMQWNKHAITVSPLNPTLVVATAQTFTVTGGTGAYTLNMATNLSGGSLNSSTYTYTAGALANVTDVLEITDSLGSTLNVNISTVAGAADHLNVSANNNQTKPVGSVLAASPKVQLVDRFNNGVANVKLHFQVVDGDAQLVGNIKPTTDSNGYASIGVRLGYNAINNSIRVSLNTGTLPDLAGSGNATVTLTESSAVKANGTGRFGLSFPTVTSPGAIVVGNFGAAHTDNTHRDIATINTGGSNVGILLNNGNGIYTSASYTACAGPTGITSGDFNGDSITDLAVSCSSGFVAILIGNSDGTFQPAQTFVTAPGPVAIVAGDFNGDGKLDLAVASSVNSTVGIHVGGGNGSFQAINTIGNDSNLSPVALAAGDLNKDGAADLVVLNGTGTNTLSILINQKIANTVAFYPNVDSPTGQNPTAVAVGDFNRDGWPDVAVTNSNDGDVELLINDGTGSLSINTYVTVGGNPLSVQASDLQASGYAQDLVVVNGSDNSVGIVLNTTPNANPSLSFDNMVEFPFLDPPEVVVVGDTNGDGNLDLIVAVDGTPGTVQVLTGQGGGQFGNSVGIGNNPVSVATGLLFTGDSHLDLVIANENSNTVSLLRGVGVGVFSSAATLSTAAGPIAVALGDLNGDGVNDIVVLNHTSKSVSIFLGNGDGTFQNRVDYPVANAPTSLALQDFNSDGSLDIVVTNSASNSVSVLLGNGDGTLQSKVDYATGGGPLSIVAQDFNHDGIIDLAVANSTDGSMSILLGNGDGTFQTEIAYLVGANPNSIIMGDFNGDGVPDLAVLNNGDGTISIMRGVGDGSFVTKATVSVGGASMQSLVTGDFHGLGRLDIAVTDGDNTFAMLKGHGDGNFDTPVTMTSSQGAAQFGGIVSADFNGDGVLDLILLDANDSDFEIWMGQ